METITRADCDALETCRKVLTRRIDSDELRLPVLPQVAGQVVSLSNDPNAELGELSSLIHQDQALAGHLLRISNSVAYRGGETIVSLQQAVTRLGMQILSDMAMAVSVQGEDLRVPGYEDEVKFLLHHALASGAYGREVARMSRRNVESQFLCGLLHTIGKPIVLKAVAEIQDLIALSLSREEIDELLDEFHCPIGLSVAQKWKLPRPVQISISCYRNYSEATEFRDQTAMTYLADRLATWAVFPEKLPTAKAIDDPVFADLNFYPEDIEALLGRKGEILEIVAAMQI